MSDNINDAEIARLVAERTAAPSVRGLFDILRASSYGFDSCVLEYFDNSIDAGATSITIRLLSDKKGKLNKIMIIDNGCGMTLEALIRSFCIGDKTKFGGKIGKYGAGWKTASINLANKVYFMTRNDESKPIVGLFADIGQMETDNSYRPTATYEDARDELTVMAPLANLIPNTGSIIILTDLNDLAKIGKGDAKQLLLDTLRTTYNVPNTAFKVQCDNEEPILCELFDPIYTNDPAKLHYPQVSKTLRLYENKDGVRVCEKADESWKEYLQLGHNETKCMVLGKAKYPLEADFIGEVQLTLVQVAQDTIHNEPKKPINIESYKYRYFTVQRGGIRTLTHGVKLGGKLPERVTASDQFQRCLINFPETLDTQFAGSFNKLAKNDIPCFPLRRALHFIYKDVTAPWNKEWKDTHKEEDSKSATTETSHVPTVATPKGQSIPANSPHLEESGVADEESDDSVTENTISYKSVVPNILQMMESAEPSPVKPTVAIEVVEAVEAVETVETTTVEQNRPDSPSLLILPTVDTSVSHTVEPVQEQPEKPEQPESNLYFICREYSLKIPYGTANPRSLKEWYSGLAEEHRIILQLAFPL